MNKLVLLLALVPALSLAAPASPPGSPPAVRGPGAEADDAMARDRMQKRMRLARTLGLAEALDLDERATLRIRDVMARFDERRAPLEKQIHDDQRVLRDAASGDKAAAGQVDTSLSRMRDTRGQLHNLEGELLQQLTQGMAPEKKARAALFLAQFQQRAMSMGPQRGGGSGRPGHGGRFGMPPHGGGGQGGFRNGMGMEDSHAP